MILKVYSLDGKELRDKEVSDALFNSKISTGSIYYAIKNELANKRIGTASTKTRSEVSGTHQKIYRQKGTGRARAGTKRSPTRVKGGIAFGPKPRDYSYKIPKKIKRLALVSALSMKAADNKIRVVEDFTFESGKTKDLSMILKNHIPGNRSVFIVSEDAAMLRRAGGNIPWLNLLSFSRLNVHEIFYGQAILIQESTLNKLQDHYKV
ncbi:MAG: 50S ribosomal protein L4 [Spirochaetales bacterium]|nr:50S ribosomal protein L4 [Spirochaetales bacterium]